MYATCRGRVHFVSSGRSINKIKGPISVAFHIIPIHAVVVVVEEISGIQKKMALHEGRVNSGCGTSLPFYRIIQLNCRCCLFQKYGQEVKCPDEVNLDQKML